jgi:hypothetical protein
VISIINLSGVRKIKDHSSILLDTQASENIRLELNNRIVLKSNFDLAVFRHPKRIERIGANRTIEQLVDDYIARMIGREVKVAKSSLVYVRDLIEVDLSPL